jgi:hypothetical protein
MKCGYKYRILKDFKKGIEVIKCKSESEAAL